MKLQVIIFAALFIFAFVQTQSDEDEEKYQEFLKKYRSSGDNTLKIKLGEIQIRKQIFMDRLSNIKVHNKRFAKGLETYQVEINAFSDLTNVELKRLNGLRHNRIKNFVGATTLSPCSASLSSTTTKLSTTTSKSTKTTTKPTTTTKPKTTTTKTTVANITSTKNSGSSTSQYNNSLNTTIDWRTLGALNPIRDQGYCGSCWAFSAVTAWEAAWFRKTGQLLRFSEQQLVDCSLSCYGCYGGWMSDAWTDSKAGIMSRDSYAYTGSTGICKTDSTKFVANVSSVGYVAYRDEVALINAIKTIGPISVAMYASGSMFTSYKSGVYYDTSCTGQSVDHAVVAVGYGTLNGMDYYLVRNSWGTTWGINGYFLIARNKNSHCGIADYGQYPIV